MTSDLYADLLLERFRKSTWFASVPAEMDTALMQEIRRWALEDVEEDEDVVA
jgi:hypothetical protein